MVRGKSIIQGQPDVVRANKEVQDAYLGETEGRDMLSVDKIHTYYGLSHILFDVSLTVSEGEIVGLLGRNGAGKSTTMRSIMGLTPPRQGKISFKGELIAGRKAYLLVRAGNSLCSG